MDEIWEWAGEGIPDKRADRGRVYYKRVSVRRRNSPRKRYFRVGDPVVMSGDDGQVWIAQIVNLFQAQQNDIHIKELIRNSSARNEDERRHELMRCTLRWFYNLADMNHHTLTTSRVPKPVPDEIWFSDHVEQDGFNDVQVIEGRAWLFPNVQAKHAFLKDPDPMYNPRKDMLKVVRCFVDSKTDHLPVRELERTELERLLRNPTTDKDLFENSRLRLYGSAGAVLKGTGKKKRRHSTLRSPVNVDEDEYEPAQPAIGKKRRTGEVEAKVELGLKGVAESERTKGRTARRRKINDNDDDEESGISRRPQRTSISMDDDDEPLASRMQALDQRQQQQADARRIEKENEEVFAWVSELNDNAYNGNLDENTNPLYGKKGPASEPGVAVEVDEISAVKKPPANRHQNDRNGKHARKQKSKSKQTETIIIDDDGDPIDISSRKVQRPRIPNSSREDKQAGNNRQSRDSLPGKSSFAGKPFMPTKRARKPSTATVASKSSPSSPADRNGTAQQQQRSSTTALERRSAENASSAGKKVSERSQTRKAAPQASLRHGRSTSHHSRPASGEFLAEITSKMNKMKLELAKLPKESKSVVTGKMEWLVSSVVDKIFDGQKERANDLGDAEARRIVDLTLGELKELCNGDLNGSKKAHGPRSGTVHGQVPSFDLQT